MTSLPSPVRRGAPSAALALLAYLLLAVALTLPLARHFTHAIPGEGFDGWQNLWNLWWVKRALLIEHSNPWFTDMLYSPTGVGLLFHTLNAFNGFASLPIQLAFGLFPTYNAIVLFSFAVSGLGAYLLARHVLGPGSSRLAALGAGVIFAFSPYHFAHLLGHMQLVSMEWVPFYALYLLRTVDAASIDGTTDRIDRSALPAARRNGLIAVFFLTLVALCDWYYVLYCLIFTAVALAWQIIFSVGRRRNVPRRMGPDTDINNSPPTAPAAAAPRVPRARPLIRVCAAVAIIWLVWAITLSPLLAPMIREARRTRFMVPDPEQSRTYSADIAAFVTPQAFHPLWRRWTATRSGNASQATAEHEVFAGFTVLGLAILGLIVAPRAGRMQVQGRGLAITAPGSIGRASVKSYGLSAVPKDHGHGTSFWLLVLLVFFVLALGPVLQIGGQTGLLPSGREVVLPYFWIARAVPFMEISRVPSRCDVMVMLALAILASGALNWLARRGRSGRGLAAAGILLILFEFLPIPYPLNFPNVPGWYRTLAADPRPGNVLNVPMHWDPPQYLLYQTVHNKPLVAGYISRDDPRTLPELAPVLGQFRHLRTDVIAVDLNRQGSQVLDDLGVRWVVFDRQNMPKNEASQSNELIMRQIFGAQPPVFADERLTVYEIERPKRRMPFLILGENWGAYDEVRHSRCFSGAASVLVQSPTAAEINLQVSLAPGSAPLDASEKGDGYVVRATVKPGPNVIQLRAKTPGGRVEVRLVQLEEVAAEVEGTPRLPSSSLPASRGERS